MFETLPESESRTWKALRRFMFRGTMAVPTAGVIGWVPETLFNNLLYGETRWGGICPSITVIAGVVGFIVNKSRREEIPLFVCVPNVLLFLWAFYGDLTLWDYAWAHRSRWQYALDSSFGPNCSSSECLGLIVTSMAAWSMTYSLGALLALRINSVNELSKSKANAS